MTDVMERVTVEPTVDEQSGGIELEALAPPRQQEGEPVLAAVLAGAGAIHFAMAPSHLDESTVMGVGFLVAGAVQLVLAVVLAGRAPRWARWSTVFVSVALIAAWAVSRTAGLPLSGHAGEVEDVTVVDGICVGLEAAAIGLALRPRRRAGARRFGAATIVGVLAALALTTAAIASPDARDHAAGGHGHGDEEVNDLGFAALQNGQMGDHDHSHTTDTAAPAEEIDPVTAGQLASQLALTAPLVQQFPTIGAAKAAGFRQAGPFAPGLGIHYSRYDGFNSDGVMDPGDIANPYLIFDGTGDDAPLAGFMYMMFQETAPEGFVGPLDQWHYHTNTCIVIGPDGNIDTPFGADLTGVTEEMCAAEGGSLIDFTGYMVHVWTVPGYESDLGTFSDLNPGITCPDGTYYAIPTAEIGGRDSTCRDA